MKPSKRIIEIMAKIFLDEGEYESSKIFHSAILRYLDEESEKNKPCEHKSSYQVDEQIGEIYYNVCNDCGVLFLAKK